jgi:hypothetical protein
MEVEVSLTRGFLDRAASRGRLRPQPAADLQSVRSRQHQIQDNKVVPVAQRQVQSLRSVAADVRNALEVAKMELDQMRDVTVVFQNQNATIGHGHVFPGPDFQPS